VKVFNSSVENRVEKAAAKLNFASNSPGKSSLHNFSAVLRAGTEINVWESSGKNSSGGP
jgi:hypothetical protein